MRSPAKYGNTTRPSLPGGTARGLGHQRLEGRTPGHRLQPADQAARGRRARCQRQGFALHPRRRPQHGIAEVGVDDLDEEHRRAVHQHPIAGSCEHRPRTPRRRHPRCPRPPASPRVSRWPRRLRRARVPTTSLGQTSRGSGRCPQIRCAHSVFQSKSSDGVQRVALAGRVVIHHVLAGELGRDEGVRPVPVRRLGEDFRLVAPHPFQLRTRPPGSRAPCPPARGWRRLPIPLSAGRSRPTRECRSPYRMAGRSGRRASSHSTRHGPTPLTHIAATRRTGRHLRGQLSADVADLAPPHRSRRRPRPSRGGATASSGTPSRKPATAPDASTRSPFVLPVPMSIPSSNSTGPTIRLKVPDR